MMIPTLAKVRAVNVLVKITVLVAFPDVPKSMLLATDCKFAAMINAMSTQMTNAVIAITSAIRKVSSFLMFDTWFALRKYIKSYMEIDDMRRGF